MTESNTASGLNAAIETYKAALKTIERKQKNVSSKDIVAVLQARDAIEPILQKQPQEVANCIEAIVDLDRRLKSNKYNYFDNNQLSECRQIIQPPSERWWWQSIPPRFVWLWTFLTAGCAIGIASLTASMLQTFSIFGFNLTAFLQTAGGSAGLIFVSKTGLTENGKQQIKKFLDRRGIDYRKHDMATFGIAFIVLICTGILYSTVNATLYTMGIQRLESAQKELEEKDFIKAQELYLDAAKFDNLKDKDRIKINFGLGQTYEHQGKFSEAQTYYERGWSQGDVESTYKLARVILLQGLQESGWGNLPTARVSRARRLLTQAEEQRKLILNQNGETNIRQDSIFQEITINQGLLAWVSIDPRQTSAVSDASSRHYRDAKNAFINVLLSNENFERAVRESGYTFSDTFAIDLEFLQLLKTENIDKSGCFLAMLHLMHTENANIQNSTENNQQYNQESIESYRACYLTSNSGVQDPSFDINDAFILDSARVTPLLSRRIDSYVEYAAVYF